MPLSGRESPLTKSVCACGRRVCNVPVACVALYMCVWVCVCAVCVWPSLACRSDRHQDCAVTAGEEMIFLSGG